MDNEVTDLIQHAYDQKPIEFRQSFDALLNDKLVQAIGNKKVDVARNMFITKDEQDNTAVPDAETEGTDENT